MLSYPLYNERLKLWQLGKTHSCCAIDGDPKSGVPLPPLTSFVFREVRKTGLSNGWNSLCHPIMLKVFASEISFFYPFMWILLLSANWLTFNRVGPTIPHSQSPPASHLP